MAITVYNPIMLRMFRHAGIGGLVMQNNVPWLVDLDRHKLKGLRVNLKVARQLKPYTPGPYSYFAAAETPMSPAQFLVLGDINYQFGGYDLSYIGSHPQDITRNFHRGKLLPDLVKHLIIVNDPVGQDPPKFVARTVIFKYPPGQFRNTAEVQAYYTQKLKPEAIRREVYHQEIAPLYQSSFGPPLTDAEISGVLAKHSAATKKHIKQACDQKRRQLINMRDDTVRRVKQHDDLWNALQLVPQIIL